MTVSLNEEVYLPLLFRVEHKRIKELPSSYKNAHSRNLLIASMVAFMFLLAVIGLVASRMALASAPVTNDPGAPPPQATVPATLPPASPTAHGTSSASATPRPSGTVAVPTSTSTPTI